MKKTYLQRQMAFYKETKAFDIKKEEVDDTIPVVNFNIDLPQCNMHNKCEECKLSIKNKEQYETEKAKCIQQ